MYGSKLLARQPHTAEPEGRAVSAPALGLGHVTNPRPLALSPVVLVVGGLLVCMLVIPQRSGFTEYAFTLSTVYAIAALGGSVLLGHCGLVSLGQGGIVAVSAYACGQLINHGVPFAATLVLGGLVGIVVGAVIGIPSLRLGGHTLAVTTLFFALVVPELATVWPKITGGSSGLPVLVGASTDLIFYLSTAVLILLVGVQYAVLNARPGSRLRLLRDSSRAAASIGVPVARYRVAAFMYAGFTAGIAGSILTAVTAYLSPDVFTVWLSIYVLVGCVMFGFTSPASAALGGIFVGEFPQQVSQYQGLSGIMFGLAVLALVVAPRWPVSRRLAAHLKIERVTRRVR